MRVLSGLGAVLMLLVGCAASGNGQNNNQNSGSDAGVGLALASVTPDRGPVGGGTEVTLSGRGFVAGMTVLFGGTPASDLVVQSGEQALCTTPAGAAEGPVTVRVEIPGGFSSQLIGAFTYTSGGVIGIDDCALDRPSALATTVQTVTEPVYALVIATGVTDQVGRGLGITAQLGYGPVGSDPTASPDWSWTDAVYSRDATTADEYAGSLTVAQLGEYDYAFRVNGGGAWTYCDLDGSANGYDASQAGMLTVADSPTPLPDWCEVTWPTSTATTVGQATEPIYGQVFAAGVTEGPTQGAGVAAELGHGPAGTHPANDPGWQWTTATWNSAVTGNNDEYMATLAIATPGTFDYAFRVNLDGGPWLYCDVSGTDDGYSTSDAGTVTVTGTPQGTIDWCNLQYPATTSTSVGAPTELIFGRVYSAGVTEGQGQGQGVLAELGYGAPGSDPESDPSWTFVSAAYNLSVDGLVPGDLANDEYMASITPSVVGLFNFAYRFSADGGQTWLYCDQDGAQTPGEYDPAQAGQLDVL